MDSVHREANEEYYKIKWGSTHNPKCCARIQESGFRSQNDCDRFADGFNFVFFIDFLSP